MSESQVIEFMPSAELLRMLQQYVQAFEILEASPASKKAPKYMEMLATPAKGKFVRWVPEMSADEMAVVFHRVRPFVLHKEPFSFNNVVGRLKREIVLKPLRDLLDRVREKFEAKEWSAFLRIKSGGEVLNTNTTFDRWINAFEYHQDADKQEILKELLGKTPAGLLPWVIVKLLFEKIQAIGDVAGVARLILQTEKTSEIGGCRLESAA
jgi:hypothetical protein